MVGGVSGWVRAFGSCAIRGLRSYAQVLRHSTMTVRQSGVLLVTRCQQCMAKAASRSGAPQPQRCQLAPEASCTWRQRLEDDLCGKGGRVSGRRRRSGGERWVGVVGVWWWVLVAVVGGWVGRGWRWGELGGEACYWCKWGARKRWCGSVVEVWVRWRWRYGVCVEWMGGRQEV